MSDSLPLLTIGTRGSPLALAQALDTRDRLMAAHPALAEPGAIAIRIIKTTGDRVTDRALSSIGGKGLFTKEIEEALLDGSIDIAVHSMKDVPTELPEGLVIDCYLPREDPRDALFTRDGGGLDQLPAGAVIGTASLRRQAQLLHARPDLKVVPFRGNVETRLAKLRDGVVDATLLAVAGLNRLGLRSQITHILPVESMQPAVAQGAVGIERRLGDDRVAAFLAPLDHPATALRVTAERSLLAALDGNCRTPIAALADPTADGLSLTALVIQPDGSRRHEASIAGDAADAYRLGRELGDRLRLEAGPGFFDFELPDTPSR
jgi:hydroxymethylbilane synthase